MSTGIFKKTGLALLLSAAAVVAHAQDVQTLATRWTQAYNKHDREALGAVYTEDARLMMHGAPTYVGRAAITEFWAQDFQAGNPLTILTVTHHIEGPDMILVHGDYEVIDRDDGSKLGLGRFAHIWIKDDRGEWRLDRDLWNEGFEPYE